MLLDIGSLRDRLGWVGQASLLREMGCDFGQGFYFSGPLPPEEASAFLNATNRGLA
jgi:EAL domain-containing protein (putative c-di-GMP-specific phosphodiesterase class I)